MKQTMFAKVRRRLYRHPVLVMILFGMVYLVCFNLLERIPRQIHLVECALDAYIPFVSSAVIPYVAWFAWVPAVLFYLIYTDRTRFWRGFSAMVGGIVVTLILYTVWPTGLNLRGSVPDTGLCNELVRMIYQMDTPTNVCPSLHVFVTVVLLCTLWGKLGITGRILNGTLAVAICCSTVLLDQHSIIDVVMGLALAVLMWYVTRWTRFGRRERQTEFYTVEVKMVES